MDCVFKVILKLEKDIEVVFLCINVMIVESFIVFCNVLMEYVVGVDSSFEVIVCFGVVMEVFVDNIDVLVVVGVVFGVCFIGLILLICLGVVVKMLKVVFIGMVVFGSGVKVVVGGMVVLKGVMGFFGGLIGVVIMGFFVLVFLMLNVVDRVDDFEIVFC